MLALLFHSTAGLMSFPLLSLLWSWSTSKQASVWQGNLGSPYWHLSSSGLDPGVAVRGSQERGTSVQGCVWPCGDPRQIRVRREGEPYMLGKEWPPERWKLGTFRGAKGERVNAWHVPSGFGGKGKEHPLLTALKSEAMRGCQRSPSGRGSSPGSPQGGQHL